MKTTHNEGRYPGYNRIEEAYRKNLAGGDIMTAARWMPGTTFNWNQYVAPEDYDFWKKNEFYEHGGVTDTLGELNKKYWMLYNKENGALDKLYAKNDWKKLVSFILGDTAVKTKQDDCITRAMMSTSDVEKKFDELFDIVTAPHIKSGTGGVSSSTETRLAHSFKSDDDGFKVTILLPGINKENTSIIINDDKMVINVIVNGECTKSCTLSLSNNLNLKKIEATCKDGILTVYIPKGKENIITVEVK